MKQEKQQELIFGIHPILELIKAKKRKIFTVYTTKPQPKAWSGLANLLPSYVAIQYVQKEALNKLAGTQDHQGIVALVSPMQIRKKFFDPQKDKFLIMLDGIQDPRNLGAILRSAYCTGVNGVIITQKATAPINAVAVKSSAGLVEHLEIYFAASAKAAMLELKNAGYSVYLSTIEKSKSVQDVDFKLPLCIVIGNEATGISKEILGMGQHITIPQRAYDISYNASVAAGILLFLTATKNDLI